MARASALLVGATNALADARAADLERARHRAADLAHNLKTPLAAMAAILVAATGAWLNSTLKDTFIRERPDIVPHLMEVSSASFPDRDHCKPSSV